VKILLCLSLGAEGNKNQGAQRVFCVESIHYLYSNYINIILSSFAGAKV